MSGLTQRVVAAHDSMALTASGCLHRAVTGLVRFRYHVLGFSFAEGVARVEIDPPRTDLISIAGVEKRGEQVGRSSLAARYRADLGGVRVEWERRI